MEHLSGLRWVILAVASHIATTDLLDRHVLDVKAHIVTWGGLSQSLVVHLHRLHLEEAITSRYSQMFFTNS